MRNPETETQEQTKRIKKIKKKKGAVYIIRRIFLIACILLVVSAAVVAGAGLSFIDNSTDLIAQEYNLDFTSVVYYIGDNGEPVELDRLYAEQNRIWVDLEATPPMLKKAFIAIEDERFESHRGVDWKRTFGATLGYIFKGSRSYGGSTITQQLIKNITGDNRRSPIRKVQEIVRALNLERKMSKDQIIEMYMNTIYLGQGCHGVQTAANVYYSKDVSKLSLAECASIAGITQYPSKYDPLVNYEAHKEKQELVLGKMLELEFITQEEYDKAMAEELKLVKGTAKTSNTKIQSYYVDQVILDVMNDLMTKNKMSESDATKLLFKGGLKIYANIDPDVQNAMESVFKGGSFPGSAQNGPQAAMVVMDPYTGYVKGIVGGRGEKVGNRVLNRATQSLRQPGSSIKPLAVYAPAIEEGLITPATIVDDTPLKIGNWEPKNSDRTFMGAVTARIALEKSRNIPAIRVLDKLTVDKSYDFLTKNLGFTSIVSSEKREDGKTYTDKYLSSLALGGLTDGVSVLEMTAAYSSFVNAGIYTKPTTYTKVIDPSGRLVLENKPKTNRAMSETTAYSMVQMMSGVVKYGTGTAARLSNGVFAAGKTGTTDNDADRWFAGVTPNYAGVVWFGYDTPKSMSGLGNPCVTVWKKVMDTIHEDVTVKSIPEPANMVERVICQASGKIATTTCSGYVRTDFFKSGTQPGRFCSSHSSITPEDKIGDTIQNESQGLNEVEPGSGAKNPTPEGEEVNKQPAVEAIPIPEDAPQNGQETTPMPAPEEIGSAPVEPPAEAPVEQPAPPEPAPPAEEDDSQYWWSGD